MSAGESLMPSTQTEDAKAELGIDAQFSRDADNVAVTTAPIVVGLTKEELEHYRNDPKYKVLRWALFILFWLTWVALFAAAIVLIVMSPRTDVNTDKAWYTVANTYEIFVPSFRDSDGDIIGDFKGVQDKLKYFTDDIKVDTLLLTSVFDYYKDDFGPREVASYDTIAARVGGKDQLSNLVKAAADNDVKIVVDIPLHVSPNSTYSRTSYVKNGYLDIGNAESHVVLLRSVKILKDLGVNGVYIHGDNFTDISVSGYNQLISKIQQQVNDNNFAIFVGCQQTAACMKLHASVIVTDPHDKQTATPLSVIDAHLKYANQTIIETTNASVTCLGNSVYRDRFALPKPNVDHFNFASLLNALRLFIYPTAHTLYGDEYGLENAVIPPHQRALGAQPQLGLMHWEGEDDGFSDSKESRFFPKLEGYYAPGFPYSSHNVRERFQGLGTLRHKLRFAKLNFTSDHSVVRYSHDNIYYVLAFNKQPSKIDVPYSSLVNAAMTDQLQHASFVTEDGVDGDKIVDASEATLSLNGYEYKIFKIAP